MQEKSLLQKQRLLFQPKLPDCLKELNILKAKLGNPTHAKQDEDKLKGIFQKTYGQPIVEFHPGKKEERFSPLKVGVVFSGGQASGGHNVITGLFDSLMLLNNESVLLGFLNGPSGIIENKTIEITKELLSEYRNQGGFDLIGSGRTKIETDEQLKKTFNTINKLELDGLVIIGGDDSNTNAAVLAEYFANHNLSTKVVGVPKTIDGDLRNEFIEMSFGFDTACKVYSELIGNICKDSLSAKKYYHFIRLMGRSASHIALECALKTHPNYTLIAEEISDKGQTLNDIAQDLVNFIVERSEKGKNYGVILLPEGLIEFIPEVKVLIQELNALLAKNGLASTVSSHDEVMTYLKKHLTSKSMQCLHSFPEKIQQQLLLDRDPHGNVQVSKIATEELLLEAVKAHLKDRKDFKGKFNALTHFFGYEGRSALPSNFDAQYCYSLGQLSSVMIYTGLSGYMSCISNLHQSVEKWQAKAIPITMLMNIEMRHNQPKPVIKKHLVDLKSEIFKKFSLLRDSWKLSDNYLLPGPIQFWGEKALSESVPCIMSS